MLHLYYFESILEQHGICYGYKVGLKMMSIQVGYNKNFIESALNTMINLMLDNIFRYKGGNVRVMLVG